MDRVESDRKPRVRADEAKKRLIAATIELLKETSVLELSTRAIGARAGLDRRAITRQFGGELELLIAVLEELQRRSVRAAESMPRETNIDTIEEWAIRTNLLAFLILSGAAPERLRQIEVSDESENSVLEIIGLDPESPRDIQEAFLALLQAVALGGTFFGPSSPRSTPENRLRIFLMLRYLASLGPDLPDLIGLRNPGEDSAE